MRSLQPALAPTPPIGRWAPTRSRGTRAQTSRPEASPGRSGVHRSPRARERHAGRQRHRRRALPVPPRHRPIADPPLGADQLRCVRQLPAATVRAAVHLVSQPYRDSRADDSDALAWRPTLPCRIRDPVSGRLADFSGPALLVWGAADRFFKIEFARRLREAFSDGRLVEIERGRTFIPHDELARLAAEITAFNSATVRSFSRT